VVFNNKVVGDSEIIVLAQLRGWSWLNLDLME